MRIEYRTLTKLPVMTEGGARIGSVTDLELDVDAHSILTYCVRQSLFGVPLRISPNQVVSISSERMVVKDTAVPVARKEKLVRAAPAKIEPIATRKETSAKLASVTKVSNFVAKNRGSDDVYTEYKRRSLRGFAAEIRNLQ